jgi:hypothetical protein
VSTDANIKLLFRLDAVALPESFNAARSVNKFLFSGKERVALGADAYFNIIAGGFGLPNFAAGADNLCISVFRMNIFFHFFDKPCFKVIFKVIKLSNVNNV